ncbi:TPA: family 1 glycosylhydrolase [Streptococcus suis]|nr:family 1 glycosylhydrolase [Streptococcus suis]
MVTEQREYRFPEGFLWGSSTLGPQSEGSVAGDGKGGNNWDYGKFTKKGYMTLPKISRKTMGISNGW